MKHKLFIFITLALTCFAFINHTVSQKDKVTKKYSNPFDTLNYDKVIAYDYNGSPEMQIVVNGQVLAKKERIFKQTELTKKTN